MDINMPILDGIDTIRRIRQLESTEWKLPLPILVFAVTGFSSPTDKE
jgi:CheY-like chemotaxis protein